jgi:ABC-type glycerol-3-phosphate transport system substrate-binding protein
MSGRARLSLVVVMLVAASACGHSSPTSPATSPTEVVSQLRISGLPASLSPGTTAQLTAEGVLADGTVKE